MKTIQLTRGYSCLVDDEDFERLKCFKWSASKTHYQIYAQARSDGKMISMHRLIMQAPKGVRVDHINDTHTGMVLDNRKSNLRFASPSLNCRNTHRDLGVWFRKTRNKWVAQAKHKGRVHIVGSFQAMEEAMRELERWKLRVGFRDSESLNIPEKPILILACPQCGSQIKTNRHTKRFCSPKCRSKYWESSQL